MKREIRFSASSFFPHPESARINFHPLAVVLIFAFLFLKFPLPFLSQFTIRAKHFTWKSQPHSPRQQISPKRKTFSPRISTTLLSPHHPSLSCSEFPFIAGLSIDTSPLNLPLSTYFPISLPFPSPTYEWKRTSEGREVAHPPSFSPGACWGNRWRESRDRKEEGNRREEEEGRTSATVTCI